MKDRRSPKRVARAPERLPYPRVFETYRELAEYTIRDLVNARPSTINGDVRIRRYEVTIRRIEESVEVLRERLLKLWRESECNPHNWDPMHDAARDLGVQNPREFLKYEEQGRDYKGRW